MSLVSTGHHLIAAQFFSRNRQMVCSHFKLLNVQDQCLITIRQAASKIPLNFKIAEVYMELW